MFSYWENREKFFRIAAAHPRAARSLPAFRQAPRRRKLRPGRGVRPMLTPSPWARSPPPRRSPSSGSTLAASPTAAGQRLTGAGKEKRACALLLDKYRNNCHKRQKCRSFLLTASRYERSGKHSRRSPLAPRCRFLCRGGYESGAGLADELARDGKIWSDICLTKRKPRDIMSKARRKPNTIS